MGLFRERTPEWKKANDEALRAQTREHAKQVAEIDREMAGIDAAHARIARDKGKGRR